MTIKEIIKLEGLFSLIGGVGLLIWWFLMPLLMPVTDAADNFHNLVLDSQWVVVNLIGLVSVLLLALGFPGFYLSKFDKFNKLGLIGLIIACAGTIWLAIRIRKV